MPGIGQSSHDYHQGWGWGLGHSLEQKLQVTTAQRPHVRADLLHWPVPPCQSQQPPDGLLIEPLADGERGIARYDGVRLDVTCHYRAGSQHRAVADGHPREDGHPIALSLIHISEPTRLGMIS